MHYAGLSQQDFAARLELSSSSLSSIFNGRTNPTNNHVMAIHKAFPEINVNWLMFGEGQMIDEKEGKIAPTLTLNTDVGNVLSDPDAEPHIAPQTQSAGAVPSLFDASTSRRAEPVAQSYAPGGFRDYREPVGNSRPVVNPPVTMMNLDKDKRKIKEIRVFFSDGTFEAFVPSTKS